MAGELQDGGAMPRLGRGTGGWRTIDYEWCLTCAQILWSFVYACRHSLMEIPEGYCNEKEIRRVLHAANHFKIKGFKVKLQQGTMPNTPRKSCQLFRRRMVRLGRLHELKRRLMKNKNEETSNLVKKLYGSEDINEITLQEVDIELQQLEELQDAEEEESKVCAINQWKKNVCTNITAKSAWINKKGSKLSPSIEVEDKVTATKMQSAKVLFDYWQDLWHQQKWNAEEMPGKIQRLVAQIKGPIENVRIAKGRPALCVFRKQMGSIKGCAGADGWNAEEPQAVASSTAASMAVWNTMSRWETFTMIPFAISNCKLVHVPKKEKRILQPGQFRPIAIMSSWRRSWSSTWMRSKWVQQWSTQLFPSSVAGGMPGAQGPEMMAAVLAHEQNIKRHGITMDFRHAFDTVNVEAMEQVFFKVLPHSCRRWFTLLFEQWKNMERWVVIDSGVHPQCLKVQQGLPQGDPGSCVVMATMMLALKKMVDEELQENGLPVFQVLWRSCRRYRESGTG